MVMTHLYTLRAQHGHSDAGVAAGGIDHGVSQLQLASLLSILDDGAGQAVLHAGQRVELYSNLAQMVRPFGQMVSEILTHGVFPTVSVMLS